MGAFRGGARHFRFACLVYGHEECKQPTNADAVKVGSVGAALLAVLIGGLLMVEPALAAVVSLVILWWLRVFASAES